MANQYMIWKNPECRGINPEWIFMTGEEFFATVKSFSWVGRYFVTLPPNGDPELDNIFIESTKEEYIKWEKTNRHKRYLDEHRPKECVLSLDCTVCDSDGAAASMHELIVDLNVDVEKEAINSALMSVVYGALLAMPQIYREAIYAKYFWFAELSDHEIASKLGMKFKAFESRRIRAIKILSKIFEKV